MWVPAMMLLMINMKKLMRKVIIMIVLILAAKVTNNHIMHLDYRILNHCILNVLLMCYTTYETPRKCETKIIFINNNFGIFGWGRVKWGLKKWYLFFFAVISTVSSTAGFTIFRLFTVVSSTGQDGKITAKCNFCPTKITGLKTSTTNFLRHLRVSLFYLNCIVITYFIV